MIFRVHYLLAAVVPHVYCRVFAAPASDQTFAAIGTLTMRKPEFVAFRQAFEAEFIDKTDQPDAGLE